MKLLVLDYIRGLWASLGERIIAILWPHIVDDRLKIIEKIEDLAKSVDELTAEYEKDIEEFANEYDSLEDRYGKLYLAHEKLLKKTAKAQSKPKDPNKTSKPIKPRVRKAK